MYFDSLDILDILRARIYKTCKRLDFEDERIDLDRDSYWFFTKLIAYLSLSSAFLFILCNFTDNGLYIINRILSEKIKFSSVIKFIPFGVFYIILCFFIFSKIRLDFRCKGIDADTSRGFITYQRSDEFKKDFFSVIGNIATFFFWYIIISLPFIFIFNKNDPFYIDISFLNTVKLFILNGSPDVIQVFIPPLVAGIIFGCLCGFIIALNDFTYFLQKKDRINYIKEIQEQLISIKERLNNRLLHDI
ncbi:MAG: hypothetical protein D3918_11900 [Candidatus Electrothrix sp. AX2]|nr:hypothetical protein [Candidatus Electrothrix gigas]